IRLHSGLCACNASSTLSYTVSAGSTLVIWNLMLSPARARSAGESPAMSRPAKRMVPAVGVSAPAMHFISVLLPEPFGPMRPWNSPSSTTSPASSSAVSLPKLLTMPRASRSGMAHHRVAPPSRAAELADPFALGDEQPDQPGRAEHDNEQQQRAEDDRPDLLVALG